VTHEFLAQLKALADSQKRPVSDLVRDTLSMLSDPGKLDGQVKLYPDELVLAWTQSFIVELGCRGLLSARQTTAILKLLDK
jgi:hypothetical protein